MMKSLRLALAFAAVLAAALAGSGARAQTVGSYTLSQTYTQNWDSVTPPALPSGWTIIYGSGGSATQIATTTAAYQSSPNSLLQSTLNIPAAALYASGTGTNTYAQAYFETGTSGSSISPGVLIRASGSSYAALNAYNGKFYLNSTGAVARITKFASGTETTLASISLAAAPSTSTFYLVRLFSYGTSLNLQVQNVVTGAWLNSSGSFVTDATGSTVAVSVTDSTYASGFAGLFFYQTTASNLYSDDFSEGTVANSSGSAVVSPTSFPQGTASTGITFTGTGTAWTASTTFSATSGIVSGITVNAGTQVATGTYTPGKGWGQTVTFSDSVDGLTETATVTPRGAKAFFIDTAGSDSNAGTSVAPWQSLTQAGNGPAEGYAPGDVLTLNAGETFTGTLAISGANGQAGLPVTVTTSATNPATISTTIAANDGIDVTDSQYFLLSNLVVVGPGVSSAGTYTSTGTGVKLTSDQTGTGPTWFRDVWLKGLTVSQFYDGIAVQTTTSGVAPYTASTGTTGVVKGFANLRLTSSTVHDVIGHGIYSASTATGQGTGPIGAFPGMLWDTDVAYNVYGCGGTSGCVAQSGQGMIMRAASYGLIQNCIVHDSNQHPTGQGAAGIWTATSFNTTMRDSEVYNMGIGATCTGDCSGFDIDGGNIGNVGERLYSHDNQGAGFMVGAYTGTATTGSVFRNSISQNNGQQDEGSIYLFGGTGTVIENMDIYANAKASGHAPTVLYDATAGSATATLVNNAIWMQNGSVLFNAGQTTSALFYSNDYFSPDGSAFSWLGTSYASLAAFRTGTGRETLNGQAFGLNVNPGWSAVPAGIANANVAGITGYNILPSSGLYASASEPWSLFSVAPPSHDLHNSQPRRPDGIDIGAVEYPVAGYSVAYGTIPTEFLSAAEQSSLSAAASASAANSTAIAAVPAAVWAVGTRTVTGGSTAASNLPTDYLSSAEQTNLTAAATSAAANSTALTGLATTLTGLPSLDIAAMKADPLLAKTWNHVLGKFTYNATTGILTELQDDGVTVLGSPTVTQVNGTITSKQ